MTAKATTTTQIAEVKEERQPIRLTDGLPKPAASVIIDELKQMLYSVEGNMQRFFPEGKQQRYKANFNLFDRDGDGFINLSELKEFLVSVNMPFPDAELEELYNELNSRDAEQEGINDDGAFIIMSKKLRENDKREQLSEAFKMLGPEQTGYIKTEPLRQQLKNLGLRWDDEEVDEFIKACDPKKTGKFEYAKFVKKWVK